MIWARKLWFLLDLSTKHDLLLWTYGYIGVSETGAFRYTTRFTAILVRTWDSKHLIFFGTLFLDTPTSKNLGFHTPFSCARCWILCIAWSFDRCHLAQAMLKEIPSSASCVESPAVCLNSGPLIATFWQPNRKAQNLPCISGIFFMSPVLTTRFISYGKSSHSQAAPPPCGPAPRANAATWKQGFACWVSNIRIVGLHISANET